LSAAHSPSLARSSTLPSLNQLRVPSPRTRLPTSSNASAGSTNSATVVVAPAPKSKGVQMVSEMRARVKVLEQKIHTRVPRLRMGSLSGRPNGNTPVMSPVATEASSSANSSRSVLRTTGAGDRGVPQRRNADEIETKASSDTSGWVLIMEDSPSPAKDNDRDRRRVSSPSAPTAFRHIASTSTVSPTLGVNKTSPLTQSTGIRRPQSRLSTASLSTATTTSSIPTPSSRPATPTFLPVPTAGLYGHASTAGMSGLKRSTGPNTGAYAQAKRSSLGSSAAMSPTEGSFGLRERPTTMPPPQRPTPGPLSSNYLKPPDRPINDIKGLPQLPSIHANITMRPPSKLPASGTSTNMLGQSRIGRPSSGSSGRRSTGGDSEMGLPDRKKDNSEVGRQRAGSTNIGKNGL
jgi:nuclear distribution protein NudE